MDAKLTAAIDDLVERRTFNLDALEAIKGLRDRAVALDTKVEAQAQTIAERDVRINGLRHEVNQSAAKIEMWTKREAELVEREKKVGALELREAVATARSTTFGEVFQTIFKNTTVRENTVRSVPHALNPTNPYPTTMLMNESSSVERIQE